MTKDEKFKDFMIDKEIFKDSIIKGNLDIQRNIESLWT